MSGDQYLIGSRPARPPRPLHAARGTNQAPHDGVVRSSATRQGDQPLVPGQGACLHTGTSVTSEVNNYSPLHMRGSVCRLRLTKFW